MALILTVSVIKQLKGVPKVDQTRLLTRLRTVAAAPDARHPGTIQMVGHPDVWLIMQCDWRAIYTITEGDVVITRIAHRREAYE